MGYFWNMQFSREFFMQRSFEVVWAVFRVGEFVKRKDLRELLEKRALVYLSEKTSEHLAELEEVVKLGMQIGEVKDVNGKVLLREIENLRQALAEYARSEEAQRSLSEGQVGEIFDKNIQYPIRQPADQVRLGLNDQNDKNQGKNINSEVRSQDEVRLRQKEGIVESSLPAQTGQIEANLQDHFESGKDFPESGKTEDQIGKEENNPAKFGNQSISELPHSDMTSYERKQMILGLLQQRNMCGMREIVAALPNVSERTLRYDVKGLVDRNLVERVGKGGPDSFLRLHRKNEQ